MPDLQIEKTLKYVAHDLDRGGFAILRPTVQGGEEIGIFKYKEDRDKFLLAMNMHKRIVDQLKMLHDGMKGQIVPGCWYCETIKEASQHG